MIQSTNGIVLSYTAFSETSVIARIYTLQQGMQSYMIQGIRKPRARFSMNLLQPLTLVEFIAHNKESRQVQRITEIKHDIIFRSIPYDIVKTSIVFFLAEVISKCNAEEESNEPLFNFIRSSLIQFDASDKPCVEFHFWFLIQLTKYLGFFPEAQKNKTYEYFDLREGIFRADIPPYIEFVSGSNALFIDQLARCSFEDHLQLNRPAAERQEFIDVILLYFKLHALHGGKINSLSVLQEVLH